MEVPPTPPWLEVDGHVLYPLKCHNCCEVIVVLSTFKLVEDGVDIPDQDQVHSRYPTCLTDPDNDYIIDEIVR